MSGESESSIKARKPLNPLKAWADQMYLFNKAIRQSTPFNMLSEASKLSQQITDSGWSEVAKQMSELATQIAPVISAAEDVARAFASMNDTIGELASGMLDDRNMMSLFPKFKSESDLLKQALKRAEEKDKEVEEKDAKIEELEQAVEALKSRNKGAGIN